MSSDETQRDIYLRITNPELYYKFQRIKHKYNMWRLYCESGLSQSAINNILALNMGPYPEKV